MKRPGRTTRKEVETRPSSGRKPEPHGHFRFRGDGVEVGRDAANFQARTDFNAASSSRLKPELRTTCKCFAAASLAVGGNRLGVGVRTIVVVDRMPRW